MRVVALTLISMHVEYSLEAVGGGVRDRVRLVVESALGVGAADDFEWVVDGDGERECLVGCGIGKLILGSAILPHRHHFIPLQRIRLHLRPLITHLCQLVAVILFSNTRCIVLHSQQTFIVSDLFLRKHYAIPRWSDYFMLLGELHFRWEIWPQNATPANIIMRRFNQHAWTLEGCLVFNWEHRVRVLTLFFKAAAVTADNLDRTFAFEYSRGSVFSIGHHLVDSFIVVSPVTKNLQVLLPDRTLPVNYTRVIIWRKQSPLWLKQGNLFQR